VGARDVIKRHAHVLLEGGTTVVNEEKHEKSVTARKWLRIPDGTKVRCRLEGYEGAIDGLTEIVHGSDLNPDGRTQYRVDVGTPHRKLAAEQDLLILADNDGLVIMHKANVEYRRHVTEQLRGIFNESRFVAPL
jgi:hypothetical protein